MVNRCQGLQGKCTWCLGHGKLLSVDHPRTMFLGWQATPEQYQELLIPVRTPPPLADHLSIHLCPRSSDSTLIFPFKLGGLKAIQWHRFCFSPLVFAGFIKKTHHKRKLLAREVASFLARRLVFTNSLGVPVLPAPVTDLKNAVFFSRQGGLGRGGFSQVASGMRVLFWAMVLLLAPRIEGAERPTAGGIPPGIYGSTGREPAFFKLKTTREMANWGPPNQNGS